MSDRLIAQLSEIVGLNGILQMPFDMEPFLQDWRGAETGNARCVVLPSTVNEVSQVVQLANKFGCPIYLQGGNTGLCFGAVPSKSGNGIVLALTRMNGIREVDRAANSMIVEAGVVLEHVHKVAEDIGRSFPLHLGSEGTAQIGGLISTNAGGTSALRYGTMRDLTFGLEIVLPDGRIVSDLAPLRKNNIGYDLKQLFIGGEGTLGIVTAASLKLHPALQSNAHAWIAFETPHQAVSLLTKLQNKFDTAIVAYELLSRSQVDLVLKHIPGTRLPFAKTPEWSVIAKFGTSDEDMDLHDQLEDCLACWFEQGDMEDVIIAQNVAQEIDFWHIRHSVSEANKLEGRGLTHDVAVSVSSVPDFIASAADILRRKFPIASPVVTCHLGDGNLHYIVMFSESVWADIDDKSQTITSVQQAIHDLASQFGGTFSAEHGIGRKLTGELKRLSDPIRYQLMCCIKLAIDPNNILNPGILFDEDTLRTELFGCDAKLGRRS